MDPTWRSLLSGHVEVGEAHFGAAEERVFGQNRGTKKMLIAGTVEINVDGSCG